MVNEPLGLLTSSLHAILRELSLVILVPSGKNLLRILIKYYKKWNINNAANPLRHVDFMNPDVDC